MPPPVVLGINRSARHSKSYDHSPTSVITGEVIVVDSDGDPIYVIRGADRVKDENGTVAPCTGERVVGDHDIPCSYPIYLGGDENRPGSCTVECVAGHRDVVRGGQTAGAQVDTTPRVGKGVTADDAVGHRAKLVEEGTAAIRITGTASCSSYWSRRVVADSKQIIVTAGDILTDINH